MGPKSSGPRMPVWMASLIAFCLKTSTSGELTTSHHSFTEVPSVPGTVLGADQTALNRTVVIPDIMQLQVCFNCYKITPGALESDQLGLFSALPHPSYVTSGNSHPLSLSLHTCEMGQAAPLQDDG